MKYRELHENGHIKKEICKNHEILPNFANFAIFAILQKFCK